MEFGVGTNKTNRSPQICTPFRHITSSLPGHDSRATWEITQKPRATRKRLHYSQASTCRRLHICLIYICLIDACRYIFNVSWVLGTVCFCSKLVISFHTPDPKLFLLGLTLLGLQPRYPTQDKALDFLTHAASFRTGMSFKKNWSQGDVWTRILFG